MLNYITYIISLASTFLPSFIFSLFYNIQHGIKAKIDLRLEQNFYLFLPSNLHNHSYGHH